ncbi:YpjP family protein [Aquibacillus rhizosphaerae]|uniref:YpjP family protein n=1 Tax=Aquibacillus rhizosphaerae TaxID=3051431 RepID=A0ABT7LB69_9BACI|nr:YpjP family protein [Aquibacillus sp. LR5S19]MDL4843101.1 YpjP family protein [Aquibacillus sp. LR5S19]
MKMWIKKISVILITFMTLGVYIPPTYLNTNAQSDEFFSENADLNDDQLIPIAELETEEESVVEDLDSTEYLTSIIVEQAKNQTISKLGPRIISRIEADFTSNILSNMEEVVSMILADVGEDEFQYYGITEEPSPGYGEKIFNLYNYRSNQDIAKFHVRRDNRPGEGYWFNFHYHLSNDGFEEHYAIGEIYWSKDTPPRWMA